MNKQYYISNFTSIKKGAVYNAKNKIFESELELNEIDLFLKEAYNFLALSYPKFFKMDRLSKLGILASEVLLKNESLESDTAIILSNSTSSLNTDKTHQESINQIVSPSIFVYTLPNIVLGEISIKYQLQSENAFFISDTFDAELIADYTNDLLAFEKAKNAVCGWIDLKNAEYDVFLCLISEEGDVPFTQKNLEQLYYFENE